MTAGNRVGKWVRCQIKLVNMVPVSPLMVGQMVHGQSTHKKCTVFGILAFLHILVQSNKLFTVLFAYADTDESILIDRDLVGLVLPPHSSVE